jgi:MoaA/NifB/PqqE/SkfB family radical SAM enzyme
VRGSHGWAEIDARAKRAIVRGIVTGRPTRGPVHAEIDVTDRCNVACYFCNQQDVRTKEQISLGHLVRLVDELAAGGLRSVRMSGGGDPLFHPAIGEFLDHLAARRVVVDNLTTNGALLGPAIAKRLVADAAREVIVSLNAVDAEDYRRMMQVPATTFERVLANVRGLVAERGSAPGPNVVVQFLIDRANFGRMPEMYALGRSLGADRLTFSNVSAIPLARIDEGVLLGPADTEALRSPLARVLREDRDAKRLQLAFPVGEWNALLAELKRETGYGEEPNEFPLAPSFRDENGHCFFSWYTATIRGNGDLYPCCLLMLPDYKPLGNALNGHFVDQWKGPEFTRMREEQREVLLDGHGAKFDPGRHRVLQPQCVQHGLCWLKNVYFRSDERFYRELGAALDGARRRRRWKALPGRVVRGVRRRLAALLRPGPASGAGVAP